MKKTILSLALLALLVSACGPRVTVRPGGQASATEAPPSIVEVRPAVDPAAAQAALEQVKNAAVGPSNVKDFLLAAQGLFNQGKAGAAAVLFQKIAQSGLKNESVLRAQYMVGEAYAADRQYLAALSAFQKVADRDPKSDYGRQAGAMGVFLIKYSLDEDTLAQFIANYPDSSLHCDALFQLGRRKAEKGFRSEATQALSQFLAACPNHSQADDARLLIQGFESHGGRGTHRIGVLVPLTGPYATFGQDVQDGVKLALDKVNKSLPAESQYECLFRDTGGDPVQAVKVAHDLIGQDAVDALLGPVAGNETASVAAMASQESVPILCPAVSRENLSSLGSFVFRNSLTNELQGRSVAQYAVGKMGLKRFAILAPQDAYGQVLADSFKVQAEALGATVNASVSYPPNATDFRQALTALGGRNPSLDKDNERENQRQEQQMQYNLKREFLKALLPVTALGAGGATLAVAWAPFVEALPNTSCPSILPLVSQAAGEAWGSQVQVLRTQDLVEQALTRLPDEARGNTLPVSDALWPPVMDDLQSVLLVTGAVTADEASSNPDGVQDSWSYKVRLDAHFRAPNTSKVKTSSVTLSLKEFKKSELLQGATSFDALFLPAHAGEIPSVVSQLRFYGIKTQLLGGHSWETPSVLRDGANLVEGTVFVTGFFADSDKGTVRDFTTAFGAQYGRRPDFLAAQAYDALRILAKAMDGARDRNDIRSRLLGLQGFDGVSGETSFDGKGGVDKKVPILTIDHGKIRQLQ